MSLQTHVTVLFAETFLRFFHLSLDCISQKSAAVLFLKSNAIIVFCERFDINTWMLSQEVCSFEKEDLSWRTSSFSFFIRDWRGWKKISLSPPVCCYAIACWAFLDSFWHCSQNTDSSDNADCWLKLKLFFFLHVPSNFHKIKMGFCLLLVHLCNTINP